MTKNQDLQKAWDKHIEKEFIKWAIKNNYIKDGASLPANFILGNNKNIEGLLKYNPNQ